MQKQYSESSLKNMNKERLIELVLVNQYNYESAQVIIQRQYDILNRIVEKYNVTSDELMEFQKIRLSDIKL